MFGIKLNSGKFPSMERDKTVYAPLRDGESSPSEKDSDRDHEEHLYVHTARKKSSRLFSCSVILLLVVTNVLTIAGLVATKYLMVQMDAVEPEYIPKSAGESLPHRCETGAELLLQLVFKRCLQNGSGLTGGLSTRTRTSPKPMLYGTTSIQLMVSLLWTASGRRASTGQTRCLYPPIRARTCICWKRII